MSEFEGRGVFFSGGFYSAPSETLVTYMLCMD